jgi:type IV secretory pathway VirJ component
LAAIALAVVAAVLGGVIYRVRSSHPAALPTAASVWTPVTEQQLSHGRFENFTVYAPPTTPRGFVVLLSGAQGWNDGMAALARRIAESGAMVAGLDVARFNASLETDGGQCVFPDGDLENLSHFVQAYFRLPTYLTPILGGASAGATLAYASLVQSPTGTFAGAVSMDFCPAYVLGKPLCKGSGVEFTALPQGKGMDFLPTKSRIDWQVLQTGNEQVCDVAAVRNFVAQVPGATYKLLAPDGNDAVAAFDSLMSQHPPAVATPVPGVLGDLPIVTVPAVPGSTPSNTFAIILSGDGGWAGLDKDVAGALAAAGIPVIGLDSLRYFWSARTPAGLAADIDRMTRYYLQQLGKQRVLLIGYSQGADVLPFAVNRLDAETRSHVALTAVMGMSEHALFEFHMTSWISDDNSGPATLPEVDRISGMPVLCIYGDEEDDTLCPKLDPRKAIVVKLKGGHHFDGDYPGLARIILAAAKPH